MSNHNDRSMEVLKTAIRLATEGYEAASGPLICQRIESCLTTALAMCKEDRVEIYDMIDDERKRC